MANTNLTTPDWGVWCVSNDAESPSAPVVFVSQFTTKGQAQLEASALAIPAGPSASYWCEEIYTRPDPCWITKVEGRVLAYPEIDDDHLRTIFNSIAAARFVPRYDTWQHLVQEHERRSSALFSEGKAPAGLSVAYRHAADRWPVLNEMRGDGRSGAPVFDDFAESRSNRNRRLPRRTPDQVDANVQRAARQQMRQPSVDETLRRAFGQDAAGAAPAPAPAPSAARQRIAERASPERRVCRSCEEIFFVPMGDTSRGNCKDCTDRLNRVNGGAAGATPTATPAAEVPPKEKEPAEDPLEARFKRIELE